MEMQQQSKNILLLEAFYGGSHKQLIDYLREMLIRKGHACDCITMSDKKWPWRMRTSSMFFAQELNQKVEENKNLSYDTVFTSAVVNLAELVGLCPVIRNARKVLYFHENQLIYPVRKQQDRDFQYGYNQVVSCLVADVVLFNSEFNKQSFLNKIKPYMNTMPDYRPSNQVRDKIASKCHVLYYIFRSPVLGSESPTPAKLRILDEETTSNRPTSASDNSNIIESQINSQDKTVNEESEDSEALYPLHIVWPHRWEHDKNAEDFFKVMFQLHDEGIPFKLSVIGQTYQDVPEIFETAKQKLDSVIINWGYQSRSDYISIIKNADVAVSTANHEFFGVSMLECVSSGCYPLVPNRLVYPEFFTECYRYNTTTQLYKKLRNLCKSVSYTRNHQVKVDLTRFDEGVLEKEYLKYILPT